MFRIIAFNIERIYAIVLIFKNIYVFNFKTIIYRVCLACMLIKNNILARLYYYS